MPPPERYPPDDPREWLNRAASNLALAKNRIEGAYLEDLCFQAQQAAEKSIKAIMIKRDIDFPYVHDLRRLLALLQDAGEEIPPTVVRARISPGTPRILGIPAPQSRSTSNDTATRSGSRKPSSDGLSIDCNE